jgi:hypothetical protein
LATRRGSTGSSRSSDRIFSDSRVSTCPRTTTALSRRVGSERTISYSLSPQLGQWAHSFRPSVAAQYAMQHLGRTRARSFRTSRAAPSSWRSSLEGFVELLLHDRGMLQGQQGTLLPPRPCFQILVTSHLRLDRLTQSLRGSTGAVAQCGQAASIVWMP